MIDTDPRGRAERESPGFGGTDGHGDPERREQKTYKAEDVRQGRPNRLFGNVVLILIGLMLVAFLVTLMF